MHVEESGFGRPLVLIHGWGAGAATWSRQLASLAGDFHVIAPDLPGFGATAPLPRTTVADFSHALRDLLDRRGLEGAVLAGWSMGGLVALDYASRFDSHRLAALVVVDVPLRTHDGAEFGRRAADWARRWRNDRRRVVHEVTELAFANPDAHRTEIEALVEEAMRADGDAALAAFEVFRRCDFRQALPGLRVPALFVFGAESTSTAPDDADVCTSLARDARIVRFDGCGHALMLEDPARFDAELRSFTAVLP